MKRLFYITKFTTSSLVIFFLWLPTHAQISIEKMNASELATLWLNKNCDNGEEEMIFKSIRRLAAEIEPIFLKAYQNGPDAQQISSIEKNATSRFETIQNALKSGQTFGLTKDELDLARKQTLAEFIANEKKNYINSYRSKAIIGLAFTGSNEAKMILDRESKNEKSEFNVAAKYAQRKLMEIKQ